MGIRDRIRGLGHRAASVLETAANIVETMSDRVAKSSVSDDAAPTVESGKGPSSQASPEPTANFNSQQVLFDAAALTKAMREAVWGGPGSQDSLGGLGGAGLGSLGGLGSADGLRREGAPAPSDVLMWQGDGAVNGLRSGIEKARASGNLTGNDFDVPTQSAVDDPKALYWDPFALVQQLGFRERPSAITYATLSSMVWRVPIIQAILQTRINQVSSFATPQHYKFETGFRVKMRDPEAKPSPADKKFIKQMERMLLCSGVETGNYQARDSFETFLRKLVRDSLTYDQGNFEIVPGRDGRPAEWYAVDAATIRLADTARLYPDDDPDRVRTVQIYDNVIIAEFTAAEMAFMVRNPRTDIRSYQYGTSELEMVVSTVTAILWAWHYNQNFFSNGSVAKGLLNLVGAIPEKQLRAFRRQWYQMVSGVENSFRTPITNAEKIEWINLHASNRDMEFSAWMDFLIKVVCSCYVMDPIEINFKYGATSQKSMFEGAQRAKSQESRERGLKPLLRAVGREIDRMIIWPINPEFTIEFIGLESQTPKELADLMTQRVRTIYTIDEIRAENDQEPLPDGLGKIILDANWMNARSQMIQQQQAEAQAAQQAQLAAQAGATGMGAGGPGGPGGGTGGAGGGVDELQGLLAQLEGKPPKLGAPGSKPGAGDAGGKPAPGVKETQTRSSKPGSIPSQTPKQIAAELQGEGTSSALELSLTKSIIEFEL